MRWISNMILLLRSLLKKDEKILLDRATKKCIDGTDYKIRNYDECKRLVMIGYKLEDRMDYLCKKDELNSVEYKDIKNKYQCINILIREFS